ncbi:MAG: UDP-N-acetylglucosamine 4,6-dehydratase [Desulfomonile tiedjei]|nr:UDP-N-acetylglucosamine 4,6-dehydratase [Desulfomonile tiedjei]
MNDVLKLIGRDVELFVDDLAEHEARLRGLLEQSKILIIGGAGSIGRATVREVFQRNPRVLHVIDINENNLVELVRDIRSSLGYIEGDFRTFCLDVGSEEFDSCTDAHGPYDYILNFSALKHVRSERDPYTLMRMIRINILNGVKLLEYAKESGARSYFSVSTDKATRPVNMMGASKCVMEMFLLAASDHIRVSSARFANVAFSDGSLLDGFRYRIGKRQPISAPNDVRRYFITEHESGMLCLLSAFLGSNRDIFFPKLSDKLHLVTFSDIAVRYLDNLGYAAVICDTEDEARGRMAELTERGEWPCYFFKSDTTGEKDFEEFYTDGEHVDWNRFVDIGVIEDDRTIDINLLDSLFSKLRHHLRTKRWTKSDLVDLFNNVLDEFAHKETFKYLDDRM